MNSIYTELEHKLRRKIIKEERRKQKYPSLEDSAWNLPFSLEDILIWHANNFCVQNMIDGEKYEIILFARTGCS